MTFNVVSAGVGGQGVLTVTVIIARAARREGLQIKQSEVHGMAQRGGEVVTHLRLSDGPIHSDLLSLGSADLIVSMEPLEGLRYLDYLSAGGALVTSSDPVVNLPNYPDLETLLQKIRAMPRAMLVEAGRLAREAGNARSTNVVMAGAACDLLPISVESLEASVRDLFASKGEKVVESNLRAFRAGREAVRCLTA